MADFSSWDVLRNLLFAMKWTVLLSVISFFGAALLTPALLLLCLGNRKKGRIFFAMYIEFVQGTPVLMQLFLVFFALPLAGIDIGPWGTASICLILYASAYLLEIWKTAVDAVPQGQWEACRVLGFSFFQTLRHVILPQSIRPAIPTTVGFSVQLIKSTALTSIIGFEEITRAAVVMANASYSPFKMYAYAALGYFLLCFPLSLLSRRLEEKFQ
ncbi:MAG: amino acid ABC transporter permease [Desulfovibrionaceae bacterium]|nr:amino acid ABC transporter permease [Desulfovibrionaceae bacterium]